MTDLISLATTKGWTEKEMTILKKYGNAAFNKSWIYVSEDLVEHDLGYTNGKNNDMMTGFYKTNMVANLEEGTEYREVMRNDPDLLAYFGQVLKPDQISLPKHSARKKYYIISGEALKLVAMAAKTEVGKQTRRYFVKVEALACELVDIVRNQQLEIKDIQIAAINKETDRRCRVLTEELEMRLALKATNEYVYITTTKAYGLKCQFKVGKRKATTDRCASLNTSHTEDDLMVELFKIACRDSTALESRFRHLHSALLDGESKRKEFYCAPYWFLKKALENIHEGLIEDEDLYAEQIRLYVEWKNRIGTNPLEGVDMSLFGPTIMPELVEHGAMVDKIRAYCSVHAPNYDYSRDRQALDIIIPWRRFTTFLMPAKQLDKCKRGTLNYHRRMIETMINKYALKIAFA